MKKLNKQVLKDIMLLDQLQQATIILARIHAYDLISDTEVLVVAGIFNDATKKITERQRVKTPEKDLVKLFEERIEQKNKANDNSSQSQKESSL